jgi:hypothetical protein
MTHDELVALALDTIDAAVLALRSEPTAAEAAAVLDAVGTTVALGCGDVGRRHVPDEMVETLRSAVGALRLDALDDAAVTVLALGPLCLTLDPECYDELQPLLDALRARDRGELLRLGAECLGIALSDDAVASRMAFDQNVGPMLWQLLPLGQLRTAEMQWMTPAARERFPWRSRGAELSHHALHERGHFAAVARRFPEAAGHLDAVLRTYPASPAREAARAAVRAAAAAR